MRSRRSREPGEGVISRPGSSCEPGDGPGLAAVGGAQDAVAVERVRGVVGVTRAGEDDAGVDGDGADGERRDGAGTGVDAEDRKSVGERSEGDGRELGRRPLVDFQTPPPVVPR